MRRWPDQRTSKVVSGTEKRFRDYEPVSEECGECKGEGKVLFASLDCCGEVDDEYLVAAHGKTMKELFWENKKSYKEENEYLEKKVECTNCKKSAMLLIDWDLCPTCKGDGYVEG